MEERRILGSAYAQSYIEGFDAQKALDGNKNSCWKAAPYHCWWMMDCKEPCHIDSITVNTGVPNGEFYHYAVDYSSDRINWTQLCEKNDNRPCSLNGDYYPANINAQFIRITMTYCSSGETVSIQDVTVMGEPCCVQSLEKCDITEKRVFVSNCDGCKGFTPEETDELEPGWTDTMLISSGDDTWMAFHGVKLHNLECRQLCGMFFMPEKDKTLHVCMEIRLDTPDGPCIGSMDVTRQYTPWLQFSCDINAGNYGVRDVYLYITHIDAPQKIGILWLNIKKSPVLKSEIIDHADEVVSQIGDYQVFFGNLHSHTAFSDGVRTPAYAYDYARYIAEMDFLGITEHSNLLDDVFDATLSRKWRDLKQIAEAKTQDDEFVAIMGSETTWYNQFGHMNIYGADYFLNPYEVKYNDTTEYYRTLKQYPRAINQWNHPWSCGNRHLDMFEPYDPELDKVMYTMELNSIEVSEEKSLTYYVHALDQGWHISPVGSQDNHHEDWGTENDIRTGIIARRLTKADLYDAIRSHRTYYSSAKRLRILFYANDRIMGSIIPEAEEISFDISIRNIDADSELERVEIMGENGKVLCAHTLSGYSAEVKISTHEPSPFYFLKVRQRNGKFAVTAPVWIEKQKGVNDEK